MKPVAPSAEGATRKRLTRRQLLARAALGAGGLLVGGGVLEANRIEVTHHRRVLPGLAAGARPIRVAQLSDLHRGYFVSEGMLDRAVASAREAQPDLVLLTGDFVSRRAGYADSCVKALAPLRPPLGAWAVLGNHDYWTGEPAKVAGALGRAGFQVLTNASRRLANGVCLVGVDDHVAGHPDAAQALRDVPVGAPIVAMSHNPLDFDALAQRPCVSFSGHTHGGQVNFPGRSRIVRWHYGYLAGWYRRGAASMYVNRGIGVVIVPLRWGAQPEVTIVDLVPEQPNT